jgi:ribosomal protein L11 methyltransferase
MGDKTQSTMQPLAGKSVIDYGCGSGVLGIAALLLGASQAWAVDIDNQALLATQQNALDNQVSQRLTVGAPEILRDVNADIVLANILFKPLMNLSEAMAKLVNVGGTLVMSGILKDQMEPLRQKYAQDFRFCADSLCDNWAMMTAIRR